MRVVIAAALLTIGFRRAANALQQKPIDDVSESGTRSGRRYAGLKTRFPRLDPAPDLSVPRRLFRAGLAGFAMCGLHPKVFPIAIAAGHQMMQIDRSGERALGTALFAMTAVVPALLPAAIEVVRPGAAAGMKAACERMMKVHGRWITAVLLIGAGTVVGVEAWRDMPGR